VLGEERVILCGASVRTRGLSCLGWTTQPRVTLLSVLSYGAATCTFGRTVQGLALDGVRSRPFSVETRLARQTASHAQTTRRDIQTDIHTHTSGDLRAVALASLVVAQHD
jgi:hypothetical protein